MQGNMNDLSMVLTRHFSRLATMICYPWCAVEIHSVIIAFAFRRTYIFA